MKTSILYANIVILFVSLIATVGALYYSEALQLEICYLCWYQRIMMFPILFIAGLSLWKQDKYAFRYIVPLAGLGWIFAVALQLQSPNAGGITYANSIGIPALAIVAFSAILLASLLWWRDVARSKQAK